MAIVLTDNQHYSDIADAIRSKNGKRVNYYPSEMAKAIRAISTGGGGSSTEEDTLPSLEVPVLYESIINTCMENYYTGDFEHIMIMKWIGSNESYICVVFLTEDFEILSYDPYTSEFTAIGWFSCVLTESTGKWTTVDYRKQASNGGNYAMNIEYSSCPISYDETILYPRAIMANIPVQNIYLDDWKDYIVVTLENGYSERFNAIIDDTGAVVGFKDIDGNIVHVMGV